MKLPTAGFVRIARAKIVDYLLSTTHPDGRTKAAFFMSHGFRPSEWRALSAALRLHAAQHEVSAVVPSEFGTKYTVDGALQCPDGRAAALRSVWIVRNGEQVASLVTAYPLPDRGGDRR